MPEAIVEHKEKITIGAAIELVKKHAAKRYDEDRAAHNRAFTDIEKQVGGQTERLDRDVIDQGRAWATRLAVIARRTAGSGYQASKAGGAIEAAVKNVYRVIGELEAMVAVDIEVSLFEKVDKADYFGPDWNSIKKLSAVDVLDGHDADSPLKERDVVEQLAEAVGAKLGDEVEELLAQYQIEIPELSQRDEEEPGTGKNRRRRRR